jgi:PAS domain S-box-containing protein
MTLRKRTVLIFGATILGLVILSYMAISSILLRGFLKHEMEDAIQNVERIREVVSDSLVTLNSKAWDWANWDDLYRFAADGNGEFIETNLADSTFVELKLNLILIVDTTHRLVHGKAFDLSKGTETAVPDAVTESLTGENPLLRHEGAGSSVTGLVGLPEGPMLVAARPVLTSESKGPIRGTLIMGVYLNEDKIKYMARETRLQFSVEKLPLREGTVSTDFMIAMDSLMKDQLIFIRPLSEETVAGYMFLVDIYGKPVAVVRLLLDRAIYQQGRATLLYLIVSLMIIGLVYSGATLLLMERWVLARVIGIIQEVDDIGRKADARDRLPVGGTDELSTLAHAINGMLEALEVSQDELLRANEELEARVLERTRELAKANELLRAENVERGKAEESLRRSEAQYRDLFMKAPIGIFQTSLEGKLLRANPSLAEALGYESPEELITVIDNVATEVHADPSQREALLKAARHSNGQFRFEGYFLRKDGSTITAEIQGRMARDGDGRVSHLEGFAEDITERKHLEEILREARDNLERLVDERTAQLNLKTQHLEEANAALRALLRQRETDREEFEESILSNVKTLILPSIEKLKRSRLTGDQILCLEMLEEQLSQITSPFVRKLSQPFLGLTPMEIQVADLLRTGKTTKEMAEILCLSESTVLFHRNNLRTKLGLKGKKANLRTYLQSLQ